MSEAISGIEGELRSNAVDVESIEWADDAVELVYVTAFPGAAVNHQEVGRALRTFVEAAEHDEWKPTRVAATVLRHQEDVLGTWHAEAEWFRQYLDYDISGEEFSERVIATLPEDGR